MHNVERVQVLDTLSYVRCCIQHRAEVQLQGGRDEEDVAVQGVTQRSEVHVLCDQTNLKTSSSKHPQCVNMCLLCGVGVVSAGEQQLCLQQLCLQQLCLQQLCLQQLCLQQLCLQQSHLNPLLAAVSPQTLWLCLPLPVIAANQSLHQMHASLQPVAR